MINVKYQTEVMTEALLQRAAESYDNLLNRSDLGFHQLPARREVWQASQEAGAAVAAQYKHLAVLGIGGSSLGIRALVQALDPGDWLSRITVIDNVDPVYFSRRMERLASRLSETHWAVISKSGNTIETLCCADFVLQKLKAEGLNTAGRFTVITEDKDSPLTAWAKANDCRILEISQDVGGRFSVLTPVGLFPAAFLGLDLDNMRQGASWALTQKSLIAELVAQSLYSFEQKKWITLFWSYTNLLHLAAFWYQQLWSESLGKAVDREGRKAPRASSPFACIGASDQHSILQQVMEGERDKFVWFLRCRQVESSGERLAETQFRGQELLVGRGMGELLAAEADATREAFMQSGVSSLTIVLDALSERELSAFFMLTELVIGAMGEAMNINAFDQPGVELGKRLARAKLANQQL